MLFWSESGRGLRAIICFMDHVFLLRSEFANIFCEWVACSLACWLARWLACVLFVGLGVGGSVLWSIGEGVS